VGIHSSDFVALTLQFECQTICWVCGVWSVEGSAINIAPEGFQCFNDSKQLFFSAVIRPESNRPTMLDEHSTKTKPRSITHQVQDGAAF